MSGANNTSMNNAMRAKNDEFYTQRVDIENEMQHYENHFKGKVVYYNCDDPRESSFFHYFSYNFEQLGLKKLIAACYKSNNATLFSQGNSKKAAYQTYTGDKNENRQPDDEEITVKYFKDDGDFRSGESIKLLKEADIVVTNPPFSLFREYIAQLIEYKKKFIVIGNYNAVKYKNIWPLIKDNNLWLGTSASGMEFRVSDKATNFSREADGKKFTKLGMVIWFTNLTHKKRNRKMILVENYKKASYPKYDNFDAIEVAKTKDIPMDYPGMMGVPITFLSKYNPKQFEIIGMDVDLTKEKTGKVSYFYINGEKQYARIIIRNKDLQKGAKT